MSMPMHLQAQAEAAPSDQDPLPQWTSTGSATASSGPTTLMPPTADVEAMDSMPSDHHHQLTSMQVLAELIGLSDLAAGLDPLPLDAGSRRTNSAQLPNSVSERTSHISEPTLRWEGKRVQEDGVMLHGVVWSV